LSRAVWAILLAALPLRLALALGTDLSPDEAYYLVAARSTKTIPPLVDHPPLVPLVLRLSDRLTTLPLELRVRLPAIVFSFGLSIATVALAKRRGAPPEGLSLAAWVSSFALLPVAGGFVSTPDAPALLALVVLLIWAEPSPPVGTAVAQHRTLPHPLVALGAGFVATAGALGKVVVLPLVLTIALVCRGRTALERACLLAPLPLVLPLLWPSLVFQLRHAYTQQAPTFSLLGVFSALVATVAAQALLWSPWILFYGARALRTSPRVDRALVLVMTALVLASALARAVPPEPNWYAPAALILVVSASRYAQDLAPRARLAMLAFLLIPTAIAAAHAVRPFLPLRAAADPTARLHGFRDGHPPVHAAGVGPYGPAAEACVYQNTCDEINAYFQTLNE